MKILFVAGTFNDEGGKKSGLMEKIYENIKEKSDVTFINGGFYDCLHKIIETSVNYDAVFWMANVPNDKEKIRNVKEINPRVLLVNSKRNDDEKYTMQELINRSLEQKANLTIELSKITDKFKIRLFDPLGNVWYEGFESEMLSDVLLKRLSFLKNITRQGTKSSEILYTENLKLYTDEELEFIKLVKEYADVFKNVIKPAKEVKRFLGNASIRPKDNFRCTKGFPTFRKDGLIYVSKRNVNKENINIEDFVPVYFEDEDIKYIGENKPSVDTPIQIRLYKYLTNINFMIHSHCYVENAPFTSLNIPCGGIEEVDEVLKTLKENFGSLEKDFYAVNLIGHGNIVMAKNVRLLKNLKFYGRPIPERIKYE